MGEGGDDLPERLGHVGAALQLALDDQAQGRALDAADREEVGSEAARGARDGAGQRRAPDQVDVLARGAGLREVHGERVEVVEGALDLVLGQRRVAGALDGRAVLVDALGGRELGVGLDDLLQGLEPDQLALAVEVRCDHQVRRVLRDLLDRLDDVLVHRLLDQRRVDQVTRVDLLPALVVLREGGVQHVALEADRGLRPVVGLPRVIGRLEGRLLLRGPAAQDLGDLLRAVVLLCDDQSHVGIWRR